MRLFCRAAAREPFEAAAADLKAFCGLEVESRQIQRVAQEMGPLKCFPLAFQILDLYHALEHLFSLAGLLETQSATAKALWQTWREQLLADEVVEVISQARQRAASLTGELAESVRKEIDYLDHNKSRMLYATYRAMGFFYGSGVVEAGCKTVVGGRCKCSGMFWSEAGATNVLNLRCALYSNQFDDVWDKLNQSDYLRLRLLENAEDSSQAALRVVREATENR